MQSHNDISAQDNNDPSLNRKAIHKYSIYLQSRDTNWLNRNIKSNLVEEDYEPIEEDIRD